MQPFSFLGVRKHFFLDKVYVIRVTKEDIQMSLIKADKPKYIIPLRRQSVLGFRGQISKGQRIMEGFIFQYGSKQKLMNASSADIVRLIDIVWSHVTFTDVTMFYEPIEIIGSGSSSNVSVVIDRFTNQRYALKSINKRKLSNSHKNMFETEVSILKQLASHNKDNHFIQVYQIFDCQQSYYLIMNFMGGKSLSDTMRKYRKKYNKKFSHEQVFQIMYRILTGVKLLHQIGVIHRDLKPDNLLFFEQNNFNSLVIADFGLATYQHVEFYQYPQCGTAGFMAPEIYNYQGQKYNEKCDMYSIGVIFKWLIYENELESNYDALDLIEQMLQKDPKDRISAEASLEHPYFNKQKDVLGEEDHINFQKILNLPTLKNPNLQFRSSSSDISQYPCCSTNISKLFQQI
ncbi:hypothetical protein pb186bvf_005627 [Paramecium bursaria]